MIEVLDDSNKVITREYKEETWGKTVDGEQITDGYKFRGKQPFRKAKKIYLSEVQSLI